MAFLQVICANCQHTFFRVSVDCAPASAVYECPVCGRETREIAAVPAPAGAATAESNGCNHAKSGGCGGCGGQK